jgi:eukaryotic-like serine/threonine-protein kinase
MPLWNEIEGQTLDGFTLRKLLRSEGRTAWFSTEDAAGAPGVLSVFEALNDEDAVEARLQTAARVAHPNLLAIRKIGRGSLEDESLVYALMEPFDQTLAEVLRDRSLAPDEAREVAGSLLTALESIEAAGLYHGHVDASGVLGVGDSIKLRSDCLTTHRTESDAPALAALLYNALTKRRYSSERDALQLPAPFATLVRAGVAPNGSLAAMRRVLNGPAEAPAEVPAPARPAASATRAAALQTDGAVPSRRRPGITIAALVIMIVVLGIAWYSFKRPAGHTPISGEAASPSTAKQPTAAVPPNAAPVGDAAAAMGAPETVRPPAKPSPAPAAPTSAAPAVGSERSVWHVVVYTYNSEKMAQQSAGELSKRFPQLEPQVFSPSGHAPYLVTLGGGMTREQAFTRREAALAAGLPKDTYAQNYRK